MNLLFLFSIIISATASSEIKNGSKLSTPPGVTIKISEKDVQVIRSAYKILSDESKWNRKDNRECSPQANSFSLYCVLFKASEEIHGEFDHRLPAIEEVRRTVEQFSQGKKYEHRLMGYNNDASTTFADIKKVLSSTEARLMSRLKSTK